LRLSGDEVVVAGTAQAAWGNDDHAADERAARALARVQALLGAESVLTAVMDGGRDPTERIRLVLWGEKPDGPIPEAVGGTAWSDSPADLPWPGRLPAPSPTVVPREAIPVDLRDGTGQWVRSSDRHRLTGVPHAILWDGRELRLAGWAGPWWVDRRWWDSATGWRGCWLQALVEEKIEGLVDRSPAIAGGRSPRPNRARAVSGAVGGRPETALLLRHHAGRWWIVGVYD
jgi:protein ImuB